MKKGILLMLAILIISLTAMGCGLVKVNPDVDRKLVVATVNGDEILKGELLDNLDMVKQSYGITEEDEKDKDTKSLLDDIKNDILDSLIDYRILLQQLEKENIVADEEDKQETKELLKNYKEYYGDDTFKEMLEMQNLTEEKYEEYILESLLIEKLKEKYTKDVKVTEEEIKDYYEDNKEILFKEKETVKVRHILIGIDEEKYNLTEEEKKGEYDKIKPRAEEVLAKAKAGEDFAQLAKEYSDDPGSKELGGELEPFNENGNLVQPFKDAAFALKVGEISDLVKTDFGYHIIKLEEKTPERILSLEEVKERITNNILLEKNNEKWEQQLDTWRKAADIKKFEKNI
ncbi:MAG: peptidylprolyl isomerase [Mahellales bacterium]